MVNDCSPDFPGDPDLNWRADDEGIWMATYDPKEVLIKKARRCMELERRFSGVREVRGPVADLTKFRELRAVRKCEYIRLRSFLRDNTDAVVAVDDEKLRTFLKDVHEGRIPPEGLLKDDELEERDEGGRSWFIQISGANADRRLERRRLTLTQNPIPRRAEYALSDAWDCWVAGLFTPAVIMCRAVIEQAFRDLNANASVRWLELPINNLSELIRSCPHIPDELKGIARRVNELANGLLHFDKPSPRPDDETTHKALSDVGRLLERLYAVRTD